MSNLTKESEGKYYLEPDTEITKEQYDAINAAATAGTSGNLSEAEILRLHQESDPASPFFKGSESADGGVTSNNAAGTQPSKSYYEPTGAELEEAAESIPEPQGTTVQSTEEVSKPYEAPVEEEHVISQEDLDENPDLVGQGVEVGDPVTLGEPVENPEGEKPNGSTGDADTAPPEIEPEVAEAPVNMTDTEPENQQAPAKPKGRNAGNTRT